MIYETDCKLVSASDTLKAKLVVETSESEEVPEIKNAVYSALDKLVQEVQDIRFNVCLAKSWPEIKANLLSCFPKGLLVYAQETPNQYQRVGHPWLCVWTCRGPITIGWRTHVISIDWEKIENRLSVDDLFPTENCTKGNYSIHAWGYEKATEYLAKILNGVNGRWFYEDELPDSVEITPEMYDASKVIAGFRMYPETCIPGEKK